MADIQAIIEVIVDSSGAVKQLNDLKAATGSFSAKATKDVKEVDGAFKTLTHSMLSFHGLLGGLAVGFTLRRATETISEFGREMSAVQAVTGATGETLERMRQTAIQLGSETVFNSAKVAEGMKALAQAGLSAQQVMDAMRATLNMAHVGYVDLGDAAKIVVNTMTMYGIQAKNAAQITDLFSYAAKHSTQTVDEIAVALRYVGPVAAAMNMSLKDTVSAVSALADAGLRGSLGGTALRTALVYLTDPTTKASKVFKELHLTLDDLNPATHHFIDIMEKLRDSGMSAAQALEIFGKRAGPGVLSLLSQIPKWRELDTAMNNVQGTAQKMANIMLDNLWGSMRKFSGALDAVIMKVGDDGLTGGLRKFLDTAASVMRTLAGVASPAEQASTEIQDLTSAVKIAAGAFAGFLIGKWAASILIAANNLVVLVGEIRAATTATEIWNTVLDSNPIGLVVGAIGGLITAYELLKSKRDEDTASLQKWEGEQQAAMDKLKSLNDQTTQLNRQASMAGLHGADLTKIKTLYNEQDLNQAKSALNDLLTQQKQLQEAAKQTKEVISQGMYQAPVTRVEPTSTAKAAQEALRSIKEKIDQAQAQVKYYEAMGNYITASGKEPAMSTTSLANQPSAREQKQLQDTMLQLQRITTRRNEESLSGEQKVIQEYNDEIKKIDELAAKYKSLPQVQKAAADARSAASAFETNQIANIRLQKEKQVDSVIKEAKNRLTEDQINSETDMVQKQNDLDKFYSDQAIARAKAMGATKQQLRELEETLEAQHVQNMLAINKELAAERIANAQQVTKMIQLEEDRLAKLTGKAHHNTVEQIRADEKERERVTLDTAKKLGATEEQLQELRKLLEEEATKKIEASEKQHLTYYQQVMKRMQQESTIWANDLAKGFDDLVLRGKSFHDVLTNLLNQIVDLIVQATILAYVQSAITGLMGHFGLHMPGAAPAAPPPVTYAASGADAQMGVPYIIGEEGPELFVPSSNGTIVPNDRLMAQGGSGQNVNVQVNVLNQTSQQVAAKPQARFDGKEYVIDIVLQDLNTNGRFSQALRNMNGAQANG